MCVRLSNASLRVQANEWVKPEKEVKTVEYRSYKSCNQHATMPIKIHIQTYGNENTFIYIPIRFYSTSTSTTSLWIPGLFPLVHLFSAHFHLVHSNCFEHVRAHAHGSYSILWKFVLTNKLHAIHNVQILIATAVHIDGQR